MVQKIKMEFITKFVHFTSVWPKAAIPIRNIPETRKQAYHFSTRYATKMTLQSVKLPEAVLAVSRAVCCTLHCIVCQFIGA